MDSIIEAERCSMNAGATNELERTAAKNTHTHLIGSITEISSIFPTLKIHQRIDGRPRGREATFLEMIAHEQRRHRGGGDGLYIIFTTNSRVPRFHTNLIRGQKETLWVYGTRFRNYFFHLILLLFIFLIRKRWEIWLRNNILIWKSSSK